MRREKAGAKSTMIVVAEGASPKEGKQLRHATASGEHRLGGIGEIVAPKSPSAPAKKFEHAFSAICNEAARRLRWIESSGPASASKLFSS